MATGILPLGGGVFRIPSRRVLFLLTCILFAGWTLSASPKRDDFSTHRPVIVADSETTVGSSGRVWVPFLTIPSRDPMLQFEIVSPPSWGTLSEPSRSSTGAWGVTYAHSGAKESLKDSFSFRCQAPGRPKSNRATITISVTQAPPNLSMGPAQLDFGEVMVGESVRKNLYLTNSGGQPAIGRIIPMAGTTTPEGNSFRLGDGDHAVIPVEFAPSSEGSVSGEIISDPFLGAQPVRVTGSAVKRFSIRKQSPDRWEIINVSSRSLRIWLGNAASWGIPGELSLGPRETRMISLHAEGRAEVSGIPDTGVSVSDGSTTLEIPPPPRIASIRLDRITAASRISCRVGKAVDLCVRIINPDTAPKELRWSVESALGGGTDGERSLLLAPDGRETNNYRLIPTIAGSSQVIFRVSDGKGPPQSLAWSCTVDPEEPGPAPTQIPTATNQSPAVVEKQQDPPKEKVNVAPIEGMQHRVICGLTGKKTLEISFNSIEGSREFHLYEIFPNATVLGNVQRSIENKNTSIEGGDSNCEPNEIPIDRVIREPGRVKLLVKNVRPGIHNLRVDIWGDNANAPIAIQNLSVSIAVDRPFWMNWKLWLLLFAFLMAAKIIRDRGIFS
jgi:hypothetical protein